MGLSRYYSAFSRSLNGCSPKVDGGARTSKSLRHRFNEDRSGTIAVIFALTISLFLIVAGSGTDYLRLSSAKAQQQAAIDAAVLAAGRVLQVTGDADAAIEAARQHFDRNKSLITVRDVTKFKIVADGTIVRATCDSAVATPFWRFAGIAELPIRIAAEAKLSVGNNSKTNFEISMMLDVTGSMSGNKLKNMKLAAKDLIDIVVWKDQSQYTSKIALVPFAPAVNVGQYFEAVTGKNPAGSAGTPATPAMAPCVVDRADSHRYTDTAPGPGAWIPTWNDSKRSHAGKTNCTPTVAIMPLTNDKDALKSHVDSFKSDAATAGALGTAWAWHMISPDWASIWPQASQPAAYSDLTELNSRGNPVLRKIAILLTDGDYNRYAGSEQSPETVSNHAKEICKAMKAKGITVYTIGFSIGSSGTAYETMRDCATTPSHFFNSKSGDQLRQAFREIALQIATLRISK